MQNIIWAFSRTPPGSADADAHISIHHKIGRGTLNLTRVAPAPVPVPEPEPAPEPASAPAEPVLLPALPPSPPAESSGPNTTAGLEGSDENAKGVHVGKTHGGGGSAGFVHGALCMAGFLLVIPSGVLVVQYAKVTGSSKALQLHRLLQFRLGSCSSLSSLHPSYLTHLRRTALYSAGGLIAGGMLAYLFMNNDASGAAVAHKVMLAMIHLASPY